MGRRIVGHSLDHPKLVVAAMVVLTLVLGALIPRVKVDTDPENMLSETEAVRVFHNAMKQEFALHDMVVLGVVNETDPDGVFNPRSLARIYELTEFAKGLSWPDPERPEREVHPVVEIDLLAPSEVDDIQGPEGGGPLKFSRLMKRPPATREEARRIRERARANPLLDGTLLSEDGKALCLYLPLRSKDTSYRVYAALKEKIAAFQGDEQYYITGLPVAEDTFGVQMFIQMAISAPLAMGVIFVLMWLFFRKLVLIVSPLIVALVSVVCTMGLLIGTGHTVHIMSSMIPIFIMPIAVLDSIHILSEFFDRYQETRDRRATSTRVMDELFVPMLYTSLTSSAGFASLALTPIPPVQVFGLFVAFGILLAWALTVTFIPAFTMFIPETWLENFGAVRAAGGAEGGEESRSQHAGPLARGLQWLGGAAYRRAKVILGLTALLTAVAVYGITRIQVNDNPVKWFTPSHPIRVADRVLNEHFAGTYMAYLVLESQEGERTAAEVAKALEARLDELAADLGPDWPEMARVADQAKEMVRTASATAEGGKALLATLAARVGKLREEASDLDVQDAWGNVDEAVGRERLAAQTFKRPEVLRYVATLQDALGGSAVVGKSNSLADLVKKLHMEIRGGDREYYTIPDRSAAVGQLLIQYESSYNYDDLWHLVEKPDEKAGKPGYRKVNLWVQLKSGDNRDMERVVRVLDAFLAEHPPPVPMAHGWFGLTYINVVWQEKMVSGMLQAFLGSFLIVFVMMTVLFRSPLWGILSMVPLSVTIALIYGMIGLAGKDYDMPVAVLSSLTLGLAVDFAIHFLARSRVAVAERGSWAAAAGPMFGEPARAITRNIVVIAVGFLPLLAAPLVPYKTVGLFMASILAVSGLATLFVLSALLRTLAGRLFRERTPVSAPCNCAVCFAASAATVVLVALTVNQYAAVGWGTLTWIGVVAIPVLAVLCGRLSRREACRRAAEEKERDEEQEESQ